MKTQCSVLKAVSVQYKYILPIYIILFSLTCSTAPVLLVPPQQEQTKHNHQNEKETDQSHDDQEPPLLVERCFRQSYNNRQQFCISTQHMAILQLTF